MWCAEPSSSSTTMPCHTIRAEGASFSTSSQSEEVRPWLATAHESGARRSSTSDQINEHLPEPAHHFDFGMEARLSNILQEVGLQPCVCQAALAQHLHQTIDQSINRLSLAGHILAIGCKNASNTTSNHESTCPDKFTSSI